MSIVKKLEKNELKLIWEKYKKNKRDKYKNMLVEHYYPYVQKIANRVSERLNWKVQPDYLSSFGVDGLYKAIDSYDLSKNIKFESYANQRIKGSMIDGLRKEDPVPRSIRIASDHFKKHKKRLENKLQHNLSDAEFAHLIGMDEAEFQKNYRKYNVVPSVSLDYHNEDGDSTDIKQDSNHFLEDSRAEDPAEGLDANEFFSKLLSNNFSKTEQKIIYLHYYKGLTMEKIAKNINRSESRVSQLHKQILGKMKEKISRNPEFFQEYSYFFNK